MTPRTKTLRLFNRHPQGYALSFELAFGGALASPGLRRRRAVSTSVNIQRNQHYDVCEALGLTLAAAEALCAASMDVKRLAGQGKLEQVVWPPDVVPVAYVPPPVPDPEPEPGPEPALAAAAVPIAPAPTRPQVVIPDEGWTMRQLEDFAAANDIITRGATHKTALLDRVLRGIRGEV